MTALTIQPLRDDAFGARVTGITVDNVDDVAVTTSPQRTVRLGYWDRRRIHNLKYFTWVEQQGKTYEEIQAQWYNRDYWTGPQGQVEEIDALIEEFNARTGLLDE